MSNKTATHIEKTYKLSYYSKLPITDSIVRYCKKALIKDVRSKGRLPTSTIRSGSDLSLDLKITHYYFCVDAIYIGRKSIKKWKNLRLKKSQKITFNV